MKTLEQQRSECRQAIHTAKTKVRRNILIQRLKVLTTRAIRAELRRKHH